MTVRVMTQMEFDARRRKKGNLEFQVGGVPGLAFRRVGDGNSWVIRFSENGIRKKIGIGSYETYKTLKEIRERAREFLAAREKGIDIRKPRVSAAGPTVDDLFPLFIDSYRSTNRYKDSGEYKRQLSRFKNYAKPVIGSLLPAQVTADHIAQIYIAAIQKKDIANIGSTVQGGTDTADKTTAALSAFFKWARAKGHFPRGLENPALRSSFDPLAPKSTKGRTHMKAVPFSETPRLVAALTASDSFLLTSSMAAVFEILTGVRQHMICGKPESSGDKPLRWGDIAKDFSLMQIDAEALKVEKNGRAVIPLSFQAQRILKRLIALDISDHNNPLAPVFPGRTEDSPICQKAINDRLVAVDRTDIERGGCGFRDPDHPERAATMHGTVRAAFTTWVLENNLNEKIGKMCLCQAVREFHGAYNRAELVAARREMLQKWADYCFSACPTDWDRLP